MTKTASRNTLDDGEDHEDLEGEDDDEGEDNIVKYKMKKCLNKFECELPKYERLEHCSLGSEKTFRRQ